MVCDQAIARMVEDEGRKCYEVIYTCRRIRTYEGNERSSLGILIKYAEANATISSDLSDTSREFHYYEGEENCLFVVTRCVRRIVQTPRVNFIIISIIKVF